MNRLKSFLGKFKSPFSVIDRTGKVLKIYKHIKNLINTIKILDLINFCKSLHLKPAEFIFFPKVY